MKKIFVGVACLCLLLVATTAKASYFMDVYLNADVDYEYYSAEHMDATESNTYWDFVGTFDLAGIQGIVGATLLGEWGNTYPASQTSAYHDLFINDSESSYAGATWVGTTPDGGSSDPDDPAYHFNVAWSFDIDDLTYVVDGGSVALWQEQWSPDRVRMRDVILRLEVVPVPAAVWLLGSGLLGLVGLRRKFSS